MSEEKNETLQSEEEEAVVNEANLDKKGEEGTVEKNLENLSLDEVEIKKEEEEEIGTNYLKII